MAIYSFDGSSSVTTPNFDPAADVVALGVATSDIAAISQSGSNVVFTLKNGTSLTIVGTTLAALATSNFVLQGGGLVQFGDGANTTIADDFGNAIGTLADPAGGDNDSILLGLGGSDTIIAGNGNNLIYGGSSNVDPNDQGDSITSGTGNDTILGNGGNDTIVSASGSDLIYGGAGSDDITLNQTLAGESSTVYGGGSGVDPNDGADTIAAGPNAGSLLLFGNGGADVISVASGDGDQTIYGGVGDDTITVGTGGASVSGATVVYGGEDADTITVTQTDDGTATIYGGTGGVDTTDGDDEISVDGGTSLIFANAGDDTVTVTNALNTTVYGGLGNDTINVSLQNATENSAVIYGGDGSNDITLTTFAGQSVTVYGGNGVSSPNSEADTIRGGDGNELIYGNAGNDVLFSGGGNDTMFGGNDDDTFVINGLGNKVIADFDNGNNTVLLNTSLANGINFSDAFVQGNVIANTLVGTPDQSIAFGGTPGLVTIGVDNNGDGVADANTGQIIVNFGGAASITGSASDDLIFGGSGNDTIVSGGGLDRIVAGAGDDLIQINAFADGVTVDGGAGNDTLALTGGANATLANVTNVETITVANDGIYDLTTVDANVAAGQTLAINASALSGANTFTFDGSAEQDGSFLVTGGASANNLVGGLGADTLIGGAGADTLTTGAATPVVPATAEVQTLTLSGAGGSGTSITLETEDGSFLVSVPANTDGVDTTTAVFNAIQTNLASGNVDPALANIASVADDGNGTLTITYNASAGDVSQANYNAFSGGLTPLSATTTEGVDASGGFGTATGADVLTGGAGADAFVINGGSTTLSEIATITDFVSGTDTINFDSLGGGTAANAYSEATTAVADFTAALNAANTEFASAAPGAATTYNLQFTANEAFLFVDADGDGTADAAVRLTGVNNTNFAASDIIA